MAIVFVASAAVMSIEILGTRIVGPVFGVNLFVWSALLSVTLAALAAGYFAGGVIVDRRPSDLLAGLVVLAAGALLGFVPPLRAPVLRFAAALGARGGPLLSPVLLFVPSLALLGMLGPIAVRLATDSTKAIGDRVGGMYGVSTAGVSSGPWSPDSFWCRRSTPGRSSSASPSKFRDFRRRSQGARHERRT